MNSRSMLLRLLVAGTVPLVALSGCGGGGGGGRNTSSGVFTYFANFGAGAAGESEVVTLTNSAGSQVAHPQVVNAPSSGNSPQKLTFTSLPASTVYVQVTLFTGPNGTGTAKGSAQAAVDGSTSSTITADVGTAPASVVVAPAVATVQVGQNVPLAAELLDASGNLLVDNLAPTWSISSGAQFITLGQTGTVTGNAAGQAVVQATYGSLAPGSATVNVTSVVKETWTIMVFLNSANSLDEFSYGNPSLGIQGNVPQMENIAETPTSATRIVLQWKLANGSFNSDPTGHPFNGTRRYLVVKNGLEEIQDLKDTVDMGDPNNLRSFVQWTEQNYPAQHYALVMWDHGNGWERGFTRKPPKVRAISEDDETGNVMEVWQLGAALAGTNLDIISFDACLMQMLEVQDEVRSVANYMVCAEDNTPGPGYPYDKAFGQFFSYPNGATTDLAKGIVDNTINYYANYSGPVSQSVVDLTKVPALVSAVNGLSQSLISAGSSVGSTVSSVRTLQVQGQPAPSAYDAADGYFYWDLGYIAGRFADTTNFHAPSGVVSAAQAVKTALSSAVVYSRQNGLSPDSTGISIEFGNQPEFSGLQSDYSNLQFATQTSWPSFLGNSGLNPAP